MITETSAVAFRQNRGEMLNLVQYRNDSILIKKDGKPVAALVDALSKAKPAASKGVYLRKVAVSSTMGVGVRVDLQTIAA